MITTQHNPAYGRDRIPVESRLARPAAEFIDVHCHCLPHLDDGPESVEEALALCRKLVEDGVSTVVATPHQLGRFENRTGARAIRRATQQLNGELQERGIGLVVLPGAEVRVDERIDELLSRDEVLTLADAGRHLLLELPWDVLIDIEPLLLQLACRGVRTILAHPERNVPLLQHPQVLRGWLACGIGLQVTAASLMGDWGRHVKGAAWGLLTQGCRVCVATDAHDEASNGPHMTAAFQAIAARLGCNLAHLLCVENPARVIRGERLAPVLV
jgi:protein-tyrosine phosphatase